MLSFWICLQLCLKWASAQCQMSKRADFLVRAKKAM
jgi:hypothetical protein